MEKNNEVKISYGKNCNIIPAENGKMGYSEDVIIVETTRIGEDGQEITEKEIYNRENERIGFIDKDGNIQFEETFKEELKEKLGKDNYEQLKLDERQITFEELQKDNEFQELEEGKDIDGLTSEEVKKILEEHNNKDKEKEQKDDVQKDEETLREEISKDLEMDKDEILYAETVTDRKANEILNDGNSAGYPIMLTMKDGSVQFVKRDKEQGKYETIQGMKETKENETTNFITPDGRIKEVAVTGRFYNQTNQNRTIGITRDETGRAKPVVENIAQDQLGNNCSISRTLETSNNQKETIGGNVENFVESRTSEQVVNFSYEVQEKREEGAEPKLKDCATVEDTYKIGEVSNLLNAQQIADEVLAKGENLSRDEIKGYVYACIDRNLPNIKPEEKEKLACEAIEIVRDECITRAPEERRPYPNE